MGMRPLRRDLIKNLRPTFLRDTIHGYPRYTFGIGENYGTCETDFMPDEYSLSVYSRDLGLVDLAHGRVDTQVNCPLCTSTYSCRSTTVVLRTNQ